MTLPAFVASECVAFVTGSTSGIGLEVSRAFLAQGCRVVGVARRPSAIQHAHYRHVSLDLTTASIAELQSLMSLEPQASHPILINNAGVIAPILGLMEMDWEAWRTHLILNVEAPMKLAQAFLRRSAPSHKLAHISSGAAYKPYSAWSAYCSGKAALNMAMRVLAEELPPDSPTSILEYGPGPVGTPMQDAIHQSVSRYFTSKPRFDTLRATNNFHNVVDVSKRLVAELCGNSAPGYKVLNYQPPNKM